MCFVNSLFGNDGHCGICLSLDLIEFFWGDYIVVKLAIGFISKMYIYTCDLVVCRYIVICSVFLSVTVTILFYSNLDSSWQWVRV